MTKDEHVALKTSLSRDRYAEVAGQPGQLILPCLGCGSPYCLGWVQTADESYAERHWEAAVVEEARGFRAVRRRW